VVDDAMRFVSADRSKDKDKQKTPSSNGNEGGKEESNGPGYDKYKDQLDGEREEKTGEGTTTATTINQVF
jgi:hypothetical protein